MLRSMFSAVSGLRSHQTMMDVVGNNIANVNTAGYKGSRTTFQDAMSQVLRGSSGVQADRAGTNPLQIGLGAQLSSINSVFTQGGVQATGRSLDLALEGDGFFIVEAGGTNFFTRAGAFDIDSEGSLVTANGARVMGWLPNAAGDIDVQQPLAPLVLPTGQVVAPRETESITVGGNLPADAAVNDVVNTSMTVHDAQGTAFEVALRFTKTAANEWSIEHSLDGGAFAATITGGAAPGNIIQFEPATGRPITAAGPPPVYLETLQIPTPATGEWDADGLELRLAETGTELRQFAGPATAEARHQDGNEMGFLRGFYFGADGTITGRFSNGQTKILGAVAVANFNNPAGLQREGENIFAATLNSGQALIGLPGEGGNGQIKPGSLEMSNVELAMEFTNLIIAQRGFQANARSISSSDEMLADIVNLKR